MKPAPFEYRRVESVEEAIDGLGAGGGEARILAGGQSLVPMLNMRLLQPTIVVDVNEVAGLSDITETDSGSCGRPFSAFESHSATSRSGAR